MRVLAMVECEAPGVGGDHAGYYETSAMLHLHPQTVSLDALGAAEKAGPASEPENWMSDEFREHPCYGILGYDPRGRATAAAGKLHTERLVEFLPGPIPTADSSGTLRWTMPERSIGRVHGNHGNSLVVLRALAYMRALGGVGLRRVAERSVLNARYLQRLVADTYDVPYPAPCMHEFVASATELKKQTGIRAMDVVKALLDRGFHAPTVYFPLVVDEALMIEPTETESIETLHALADALLDIAAAAETDPDQIIDSPHHTPVSRPDDALAARRPVLTWDDPREDT